MLRSGSQQCLVSKPRVLFSKAHSVRMSRKSLRWNIIFKVPLQAKPFVMALVTQPGHEALSAKGRRQCCRRLAGKTIPCCTLQRGGFRGGGLCRCQCNRHEVGTYITCCNEVERVRRWTIDASDVDIWRIRLPPVENKGGSGGVGLSPNPSADLKSIWVGTGCWIHPGALANSRRLCEP